MQIIYAIKYLLKTLYVYVCTQMYLTGKVYNNQVLTS